MVLAGPKAQHRDTFSEIQKHLDINWDEEDALFDDNGTLCDMQASLRKDRVEHSLLSTLFIPARKKLANVTNRLLNHS